MNRPLDPAVERRRRRRAPRGRGLRVPGHAGLRPRRRGPEDLVGEAVLVRGGLQPKLRGRNGAAGSDRRQREVDERTAVVRDVCRDFHGRGGAEVQRWLGLQDVSVRVRGHELSHRVGAAGSDVLEGDVVVRGPARIHRRVGADLEAVALERLGPGGDVRLIVELERACPAHRSGTVVALLRRRRVVGAHHHVVRLEADPGYAPVVRAVAAVRADVDAAGHVVEGHVVVGRGDLVDLVDATDGEAVRVSPK